MSPTAGHRNTQPEDGHQGDHAAPGVRPLLALALDDDVKRDAARDWTGAPECGNQE